MIAWLRVIFVSLLVSAPGAGALLVQRVNGKLQFSEALSIQVNGKDKAMVLGERPDAAGSKNLQSIHLNVTLIKESGSGIVTTYSTPGPAKFLYPEGLNKKPPSPPPDAWKESRFAVRKSQAEKTPVDVTAEQFVAFLSGGVEELAVICMDAGALRLFASGDNVFPAQLELTSAAVEAYGTNPAMASVERQVASFMRARLERFDNGIDSAKSLDEGLKFAQLSAAAYPAQPEHDRYRKSLAADKQWLERRVAILRALAAGTEWDAFLIAYRDFEKHQSSFPDLAKQRQEALKLSTETHWTAGKTLLARSQYRRAYEELGRANGRDPSNSSLQRELSIAWTEYSRQAAINAKSNREPMSAGVRASMTQALHFANRYKEQKQLGDAMKNITEAERLGPNALPVLLAKAEIQAAGKEYSAALSTLDRYDMLAVDDERAAGNKLRDEILFQLTDGLQALGKQVSAAWTAGRYNETLRLARQGLLADPKSPPFLYYGGVASLVTRDPAGGTKLLNRYLDVSNTLDADAGQRVGVYRLLTNLSEPESPKEGDPNWFSGRKGSSSEFYCPTSLAFRPRVDRIVGSNKFSVKYVWDGGKLRSILPSMEKGEQVMAEKPLAFSYNPKVAHVVSVASGETPRPPAADPDDAVRESNVILPNNPFVDPEAVRRVTGKQISRTVAGNRFFHPFIWQRPCVFEVQYDERGRARSARQLTDGDEPARTPVLVEFAWDEFKLVSIKGFQLGEGNTSSLPLIYERVQHYQQDRLIGEEIKMGGKTSKIKYVWNANQLVSAECEKDESLDGRSRVVHFAGSGPGFKP